MMYPDSADSIDEAVFNSITQGYMVSIKNDCSCSHACQSQLTINRAFA